MISTEYGHIFRDSLGGEPRIAGHRIRVRDVVLARDLGGFSAEEIAATIYPSLSLGKVYAALAYYEDHRTDLDREWEADANAVEAFLRDYPHLTRDIRINGHER